MNKVFLHIGPHKTGSTFLQRMFVKNRGHLLNHNILYPKCGQEFLFGHFNLVHYYKKEEDLKGEFDLENFKREVDTTANVLLSSEDFIRLNLEELKSLKSLFQEKSWTVIYYRRNWNDLLESVWSETLKRGSHLSFKEYIDSKEYKSADYFKLNHSENLKLFSKVFGKENIRVLDYDLIENSDENLFNHFLSEILEVEDARCEVENKRYNTRLSLITLTYLALLNKSYFLKNGALAGTQLRINFLQKLKEDKSFLDQDIIKMIQQNVFQFTIKDTEYLDKINFTSVKYFSNSKIKPSIVDQNKVYDYIEMQYIFDKYKMRIEDQCSALLK